MDIDATLGFLFAIRRCINSTFATSIDDEDRHAKTRLTNRIVARGFRLLGCHPEPQGGHKGNSTVCRDQIRVIDQINIERRTTESIIEVPRQLDRTPTVIGFAWCTRIVARIAVVTPFRCV